MNMPLVLLNRRRRGFTAFSPSTLFSTTAIGIWLDPSDVANLAWRRNLLTYSEQFDNAVWTKQAGTTVTADQTTAPDGTATADLVVGNGTSGILRGTIVVPTTATNTKSIWMRGVLGGEVVSLKDPSQTIATTTCNLTTAWQRFSLSEIQTNGTAGVWVANIPAGGIYIWGAQLELGTSATEYQRISDVNTEVIERFPTATMFSDRAGTTPVTTPGTVVGLRLDKSKGLVLGAELVTNGTFDGGTTTGWASSSLLPSTATVTSGEFVVSAASASGRQVSAITCVVGLSYKVTGSARVSTGTGSALISISDSTEGLSDRAQAVTTNATATSLTLVFRATQTTHYVTLGNSGSGTGDKTFDNISVRELAGNHATAPTDAARPIYGVEPKGGRRNLLTFSQEFGTSPWANIIAGTGIAPTVTADAGNDPTGAATADRIQLSLNGGTASGDISRRVQPFITPATAHVFSVYLKSTDGTSSYNMHLVGPDGTTNSIAVTGSWQRFSVSATGSGGSVNYAIGLRGAQTPANANTADVLAWGAQLELGSTATNYQRVTTAYDVTESGVATCHYVQYDGSDDSLSTSAIDFTATDKMSVFAGVRKLSDAATGIITELGIDSASVNGSFTMFGPSSSGANSYRFVSRGTSSSSAGSGIFASAPNTSVLSGVGDISGDSSVLRLNGSVNASSVFDQGTGTFGNYPLFIGRRNNATLPFNGRDYGIIIVGKAASAGEISDTELWLSDKTSEVDVAKSISPNIYTRSGDTIFDRANSIIERRTV